MGAMEIRAQGRSLTTLREKQVRIGAEVIVHSRHITFQMAEVAIRRQQN
jgi:hypothetical protein